MRLENGPKMMGRLFKTRDVIQIVLHGACFANNTHLKEEVNKNKAPPASRE
uniref:Uncharacterized protein n=1 Tax=Anopheles dirus TaxID=7168 RepID=A0A182NWK9_9DIPT